MSSKDVNVVDDASNEVPKDDPKSWGTPTDSAKWFLLFLSFSFVGNARCFGLYFFFFFFFFLKFI